MDKYLYASFMFNIQKITRPQKMLKMKKVQ